MINYELIKRFFIQQTIEQIKHSSDAHLLRRVLNQYKVKRLSDVIEGFITGSLSIKGADRKRITKYLAQSAAHISNEIINRLLCLQGEHDVQINSYIHLSNNISYPNKLVFVSDHCAKLKSGEIVYISVAMTEADLMTEDSFKCFLEEIRRKIKKELIWINQKREAS